MLIADNKGDLFTSRNVEDFAVPTVKDEVWRFVPLRRLRGLHDGAFATPAAAQVHVELPASLTAGGDAATREPVRVETVGRDDARIGSAGEPNDRVAAQVFSELTEATVVTVAPHTVCTEPITVTVTGAGAEVTTFTDLIFDIGAGAEVVLNLHFTGEGTHADYHEYLVGENAHLTVVIHEDWEDSAVHVGQEVARLGRDATLRHTVAVFGGNLVRLTPLVNFTAPGGDAELLGVYFADAGQYFEQRLLVDHSEPNCRSNVLYKGALYGDPSGRNDARATWVGDVLIRPEATRTDTYEANRNLLLTEGARAEAIPNLEIATGDIAGAGHAATVGRFDDEQLFYLMARGIPEEDARKLIVRGFFHEVIEKIPVPAVRQQLSAKITGELAELNM